MAGSVELADSGAHLALRALGWGTVYAITGTSLICYGIWKLSGATNVNITIILDKNLQLILCNSHFILASRISYKNGKSITKST